jgi:molybdopterin-guanine dinucleotide biosynthesis protein A
LSDGSTAAVVLAGGRSRRMGGGEKFLLDLGGATVLERVLARLRPQAGSIAISANCDPALLAGYGLPVLVDAVPSRGPLSGLLAGLEWAARSGANLSHVATVPADTPFLPPDLVARLRGGAADPDAIAIAASAGRRHPVAALWPLSLAAPLRRFLEQSGDSSVMGFAAQNAWTEVDFPLDGGLDPFFNINEPADLALARERIGKT